MAEVTVYSSTADGNIENQEATWADCQSAAAGDAVTDNSTSSLSAIRVFNDGPMIHRAFFYFDLSSIPLGVDITSAIFSLYCIDDYGTPNISAQQGTQADALVVADFDAFTGSEFGHASVPAADDYVAITFNAAGHTYLEGLVGSGTAKICIREYDHDYLNVDPGATLYGCGCRYTEYADVTSDPKLVITYTIPPIEPADADHLHTVDSVSFIDPFSFSVNEAYHEHISGQAYIHDVVSPDETYHILKSDDGAIVGDIIKVALTLEYLELESTCSVGWSAELTLEKLQVSASTGSRVALELEKFLCSSSVGTGIISNAALSLQNFTLTSEALIGSVFTGELTLEELLISATMTCQPQSSCELILEAFIIDCFCSQGRRFDGYILRYNRDNYEC